MPDAQARRRRWIALGLVFAGLLAVIFVLGSLNISFLEPDEPSEVILLYVFSGIVFLAFVIHGLVLTRYLVRVYVEHRQRVLGSRFKTKMVVGALALSFLPVVALFFISYALVNRTLAKWFPRPLEIVRDDALTLARHLTRVEEDRAAESARLLAENPDLQRQLQTGEAAGLEPKLGELADPREVLWAAVVDAADKPVALYRRTGFRGDFSSKLPEMLRPREALAYTTTERTAGGAYALARARIESARGEPLGAVVVAQPFPAALAAKIEEIETESREYETLTRERKSYRGQALLILLLITTLLLLAATWSALFLAKQVTIPIQALAVATEEVSRGNFDYRVDAPAQDELGTLVSSFNQMTAQLGESRRRLENAVTELEQRRQWMETILESIPTGVLTLSPDRRVLNANAGAQQLLGAAAAVGATLEAALPPETARACEELVARASQSGFAAQPMDLRLGNRLAHVAASVSALRRGPANQGYVLVLDDLTDLLKAQKAAAWQEVAQRVAHEIKNPLTPIQLSADRIRRYLEREPGADPEERARFRESLGQCAALIAEEVHHLKGLVDEFSRFARFPEAQPVPTQLNDVVESTLAVYRDTLNGVRLTAELASDLPLITADPALLRSVLTNLIDNACEAVAQSPRKTILVSTRRPPSGGTVELAVADSGAGLSPDAKERLFLPFYSTKPNGTGLGLAIVSRIVAEHHGRIRVEDNRPTGARFVVELPVPAAKPAGGGAD